MGRGATIATGNVWYEARIEASRGNERLKSRFGAAEEAGMSEDAIKSTELGLEKHMPVEKAVILADLYGSPELLNHYCLHECPIGNNRPISEDLLSIEQVVVKFMKRLKVDRIEHLKDKLVEIAEDGKISKEEFCELEEIQKYLDDLAMTISEFRLIYEKFEKKYGNIDEK